MQPREVLALRAGVVHRAVHVGLYLRKSETRGETMPVAKRENAWYVQGMCVAHTLVWRVRGVKAPKWVSPLPAGLR